MENEYWFVKMHVYLKIKDKNIYYVKCFLQLQNRMRNITCNFPVDL